MLYAMKKIKKNCPVSTSIVRQVGHKRTNLLYTALGFDRKRNHAKARESFFSAPVHGIPDCKQRSDT